MQRDVGGDTGRVVIGDLDALRALAHPERAAILRLLMSGRARTATECAEAVDATPSACSYHLRQLERFGFVERVPAGDDEHVDRRTRRWRAAAVGFSLGASPLSSADPGVLAVYGAVWQADRIENDRMAGRFAERFGELPAEWQDAADFANYQLLVTPAEIERLVTAIDALLVPYRVGARTDAPDTARVVHATINAFPRIDDPL